MSASGSGDEEVEQAQGRVGTSLRNKWRLDALLGVGGMAAVYAATHKLGRRDAIKILHPQIAVSKELRARFEQEAHAISRLRHPGTVQVLDIDVTDEGAPFMVMELLDGESLGQRAYRLGGISERELLGYMSALLEVLAAAHAQGIVHRDIKPDNLFICHDGTLKVLDFGIARMKEGGPGGVRTRTGAMLGTTSYMAPEQIHAKAIDGRADVFGVGATMFRILAKRRVHEADTDAELLMKMGSTPAPPIRSVAPEISIDVARIVDRALVFDRDRRYPDALTMQRDVAAVLAGSAPPFATQAGISAEAATHAGSAGGAAAAGAAVVLPAMAAGAPPGMTMSAPTSSLEPTGVGPTAPGLDDAAPRSHAAPSSASHVAPASAGPPHGASVSGHESFAASTHHGTVAAWGGGAVASADRRKTPVATLVGVGAVMLALGGGITTWVLLSRDDAGSKKRSSASDDESDESDETERASPSATATATATTSATTPSSQPSTASGPGPGWRPRPGLFSSTSPKPEVRPTSTSSTSAGKPRPSKGSSSDSKIKKEREEKEKKGKRGDDG